MSNLKISPFKRFGLFSIINIRHYWWYYLFVAIGIVFASAAMAYIQAYAQPSMLKNVLDWAYWVFINIGIANITASGFSIYSKKNARIHILTLPVSNIMRLLSMIIYTTILPFILLTIIYYLFANGVAMLSHASDITDPFTFSPFWNKETGGISTWFDNIAFFFSFQAFLLLIGSFFPKVGVVKTALTVIAMVFLIFIIDYFTSSYKFDSNVFWNLFNLFISSNNSSKQIVLELPGIILQGIKFLGILIVPFSYYIVHLRIKELEV